MARRLALRRAGGEGGKSMNVLRILRGLMPSNSRDEDMKRRREARQARTEADPLAGYVEMTPAMWAALHESAELPASTPDGPRTVPQPGERQLPPQRRYVSWASLYIGGRYGVHGMPFGDN